MKNKIKKFSQFINEQNQFTDIKNFNNDQSDSIGDREEEEIRLQDLFDCYVENTYRDDKVLIYSRIEATSEDLDINGITLIINPNNKDINNMKSFDFIWGYYENGVLSDGSMMN
jgi:hypothetical protein